MCSDRTSPGNAALCCECCYHASMAERSITIRHVPETVHRRLASRAAEEGRSLQEFVLGELVRIAERPSAADLIARIRARKAAAPTALSADRIVEHRDADRR